MPYKDPEQAKAAKAKHYKNNKEAYRQRGYIAKAVYKDKISSYIKKAKNVPCADCSHTYPPYVMDFDHIKGEKILTIGEMVGRSLAFQKIKDEIAKCEVVCSNCHRERTFGLRLQHLQE